MIRSGFLWITAGFCVGINEDIYIFGEFQGMELWHNAEYAGRKGAKKPKRKRPCANLAWPSLTPGG
jgi:hypothetical protein